MASKDQNLQILEKVVGATSRQERLTDLLSEFPGGYADGWYMRIPDAFRGALDVQQTIRVSGGKQQLVWTQGSTFTFKVGDALYDTPDAYQEWATALKKIRLCVAVKSANDARPISKDNPKRHAGYVAFEILKPNRDRSAVEKVGEQSCSQDEFVRFLIAGPLPGWSEHLSK